MRLVLRSEVHSLREIAVEVVVRQVAVSARVDLRCAMLGALVEPESVGVGSEVDSLGHLALALPFLSTEGSDRSGAHRPSPLADGFAAVAAVFWLVRHGIFLCPSRASGLTASASVRRALPTLRTRQRPN